MTYVFSLGLVPVQDWIEKARRSRDLRAGSIWLCQVMARVLSQLQGKGAEILLPREPTVSAEPKMTAGVSVVTPSGSIPAAMHPTAALLSFGAIAGVPFKDALALPYGIPNRASGYVEAADDCAIEALFGGLQQEVVQASWDELKRDHLSGASGPGAALWRKLWQLESFREVWQAGDDSPVTLVWAAAPAAFSRQHRRENLAAAERLFAAAKRTRPVRAWRFGSAAGKCNQCGQREAVGPGTSFAAWLDWQEKLGEEAAVQQGLRLEAGERLCHVCLARRMAGYASTAVFPSTGDIAARPWLAAAREDALVSRRLAELEAILPDGLDLARALTGAPQALRRVGAGAIMAPRERVAAAIRILNDRRRAAAGEGKASLPPQPPAYLAVLAFDGDAMGRHVRTHFEQVSDGLADFAQRARALIFASSGEPFYLAGDEGLALTPAAGALVLALAIRGAFAAVFGGLAAPAPTLSLGLVFFEHSRPLAGALHACRAALRLAKALPGKNALGAGVETASGSAWSVAAPWGEVWDGMESAVSLIRRRRLAGGWAHDVEAMLGTLPRAIWAQPDLDPVREEVRRLFARRYRAAGRTAVAKREDRQLAWASLKPDAWWKGEGPPAELAPRPEQFRLLAFLAREEGRAPAGEVGGAGGKA